MCSPPAWAAVRCCSSISTPTPAALTPNTPAAWQARPGAGPRHLRFHPNGHWVYLLNELDATVDRFTFDPAAGHPAHQQTIAVAADQASPASPGRPTCTSRPMAAFSSPASAAAAPWPPFPSTRSNGALTLLGHTDTEAEPRGFAITPDGQHLLAVGQASHHLSRYAIDPATAALTLRQRLPMGQNPNWIEITAMTAPALTIRMHPADNVAIVANDGRSGRWRAVQPMA